MKSIDPPLRRSDRRRQLYELGSRIIAEGRPKPVRPAPRRREAVTVVRPGPKQADCEKAKKEFAAAIAAGATADQIIEGAKRYAASDERIERAQETGSERYTKNPANWLRAKGWQDHYTNSGSSTIDNITGERVLAPPKAAKGSIDAVIEQCAGFQFGSTRRN
jgi:hypothetical protein